MKQNFACHFVASIFLWDVRNQITLTSEQIRTLTPDWKGERTADGRPHVSDQILERLKNVSMEEAWGILREKGFNNQFEGDWMIINPDSVMTGRVVTTQYMPMRADMDKLIKDKGKEEGRVGAPNSWPIDVLKMVTYMSRTATIKWPMVHW